MDGDDRYLTTTQVAKALNTTRKSVWSWASNGLIPGAFRLPSGQFRIPASAVELIKANGIPQDAAAGTDAA